MLVYLTNLGAYTEGELRGNWVDPSTCDWEEELEKIGIGESRGEGMGEYEEYFITDYDDAPFDLGEYESLDHLTEIANYCEEYGKDLVGAMQDNTGDWDDTVERLDSGDYSLVYLDDGCWGDNTEKLGYAYVEEGLFGIQIPPELENYIDYSAIGRTIETGSCGDYVDIDGKTAYLELY